MDLAAVTARPVPAVLVEHLRRWIGAWPPARPVALGTGPARTSPTWDGSLRPVCGIVTDTGAAAVGLPPDVLPHLPPGIELAQLLARLPDVLGTPGRAMTAAFRWTTAPADLPDAGTWLPLTDPRVPPWLHPFGGEVLLGLDDDGRYLGGVGVKRHDRFGHELAVVTAERARGRGLARRLVAQAARRVLSDGAVPTYLHAFDNEASARVASAAGFADEGWQVIGFAANLPGN